MSNNLVTIFIMVHIFGIQAFNEMMLEKTLQDHMENTSYRGTIRPINNFEVTPNTGHQGTMIEVELVVNELGRLSETENDYSATLTLNEKWTDKRLVLDLPFEFLSLTYLKTKIWIPDLYYYNIKSQLTTPLNPSLMWLYPNGTIVFSTTTSMKLHCHMDLWRFPLDSQECAIEMGSYGYPSADLVLKWWHHTSEVSNNIQMKHVMNSDFLEPRVMIGTNESYEKLGKIFSVLIVKFNFKRNVVYHLVFTFLPSTLIVSVSWVSFFIDYKAAPARVPFSLLTLLSIMTQWTNINSSLPRVSYLKSIDVWMFICLFFIILSLFEYAIVNRMAMMQETNKSSSPKENLLKTDFHLPSGSMNLEPMNGIFGTPSIINDTHSSFQNNDQEKKKYPSLRPADIDKISSYVFPLMFVNVNLIFWGVLWLLP